MTNSSRMIWHIFNLNRHLNLLNEIHKDNELEYGHLSRVKKQINKIEKNMFIQSKNSFSF